MAGLARSNFFVGSKLAKANQGPNTDMTRVAIVHKMIDEKTPFTLGSSMFINNTPLSFKDSKLFIFSNKKF